MLKSDVQNGPQEVTSKNDVIKFILSSSKHKHYILNLKCTLKNFKQMPKSDVLYWHSNSNSDLQMCHPKVTYKSDFKKWCIKVTSKCDI